MKLNLSIYLSIYLFNPLGDNRTYDHEGEKLIVTKRRWLDAYAMNKHSLFVNTANSICLSVYDGH